MESLQDQPATSSWIARNRYWFFALVAVVVEVFLLWCFGPVAIESGGAVLRPLAGVPLLLALGGSTLWFLVSANIRLVQVVRGRSGWLRYPIYAVAILVSLAFSLTIAFVSLVAALESFGSESYYVRYVTPDGQTVVSVSQDYLDPWATYHVAHGPFLRESAEYDGAICDLTIVKPKYRQGEPPGECGGEQASSPDIALPPESQAPDGSDASRQTPFPGYDVDPNARPTGDEYFVTIVPASRAYPQVQFWAYSSASASSLQRSVDGGARETATHPQGSDEALRFLTGITRLDDGRLEAVVEYPSWVDADVEEFFYSDDDGRTWSK